MYDKAVLSFQSTACVAMWSLVMYSNCLKAIQG